ncbi:hypothetical protein TI03_00470 [Achromatium sp. WMS1]|nr:hypothetical protein TI03_00470 [Achromatium sp. WMS1]
MFEWINILTNDILEPIGIWIGIITTIPIFWTWYDVVWGQQRQRRKWLAQAIQHSGTLPAILIVDLLPGKDVRAAVEHFKIQDPNLRAIPNERIFIVKHDTWLTPKDASQLVAKVRTEAANILDSGADVVHCFHAGPVFAAAVVGAEFANASCRLMLYQNEQGKYINFGPLRHPGL